VGDLVDPFVDLWDDDLLDDDLLDDPFPFIDLLNEPCTCTSSAFDGPSIPDSPLDDDAFDFDSFALDLDLVSPLPLDLDLFPFEAHLLRFEDISICCCL
jgi:hypothetical protein